MLRVVAIIHASVYALASVVGLIPEAIEHYLLRLSADLHGYHHRTAVEESPCPVCGWYMVEPPEPTEGEWAELPAHDPACRRGVHVYSKCGPGRLKEVA